MTSTNKKTAYSILDLASVSEGSTPATTFKNSLALAQEAETLGYTRYWLAEHHNSISIASSAPAVLIGYIAEGTKTIRVGSGGIMLPNHSSLIVAEQFGTLGALYPNRIDLGLGRAPGTDQLTAYTIRPDRMKAVYQFPEELQKIQEYFSKDNDTAKVRAPVAEGVEVPIYILGSSTDSAYLAAKKGLPYAFASHFAPTHLMEALAIYRNNFQPSSYLKEPYTLAGINVIAAADNETAERISTTLIRAILGIITGNRKRLQKPIAMTEELRQIARHPAIQQMMQHCFIGTSEKVQQVTKAFIDQTQVDELIVATYTYYPEDRTLSYQLFAKIMKALNGEEVSLATAPV